MKILVTYPLSPRLVRPGLGEPVVYRPELASQPESALFKALAEHQPDAALVGGGWSSAALQAWQRQARRPVRFIRRGGQAEPLGAGREVRDAETWSGPSRLPQELQALALAERSLMAEHTANRLALCGVSPGSRQSLAGSRVTLVGAGIVNLITALALVEHRARVEVLEASPDPRTQPPWQLLGATHGGANARMFCFTEADSYNEKGDVVYAKMHQVLRSTVSRGGWLTMEPEHLDPLERAWIERFLTLPRWRAEVFTEDIHGFNIESHTLWQELQAAAPQLFTGAGYTPGILRLYAEADKAAAAEALHERLGSLERALDAGELVRRHPACSVAVANGEIARALEVRGFTLNIHTFVAKLLGYLEARGIRVRWNLPVRAVVRGADGCVGGLQTPEGMVRSEHYVLSPGVYGEALLAGSRSAGKMQGILGLWLCLPNPEPRLRCSVKIHREGHVGEDSNVTLATGTGGRPVLILGSGYGYLGRRALDMSSPEVACLFAALEETAQRYFPGAWQEAQRGTELDASRKACVRPFTSTGLGLFEVTSTAAGGRMVIASGHNTGGFAQAPAVAAAVTATLEGRPHRMQALYDPERGVLPEALSD